MDKLLSLPDLEKLTGRRVVTWRKDIREGKLPVVRIGRLVRVREMDLETFIQSCTTGPRLPGLQEPEK